MSRTVVVTVDDALAEALDALARETGRDPSAVVEQALRSSMASEREFLREVEVGLADLAAGRLVDHGTVEAAIHRMLRPDP